MQENKIMGYLHVLVESISSKKPSQSADQTIFAKISLGQIAKVQSQAKKSGETWNQAHLIQVPQDPSRLVVVCHQGEQIIGECRYDVNPFFQHQGLAHAIESQLHDNENNSQGNLKLKLTYYSAEHGKLHIRIFHMSLVTAFVQKFKTAKIKTRLGIHMQITPEQSLEKQFDYTVSLVLLMPTMNLSFEVVNDQGILATYTIYNVEKSNLLVESSKAYQVSLFNNNKAVGMIKYQIDWEKGWNHPGMGKKATGGQSTNVSEKPAEKTTEKTEEKKPVQKPASKIEEKQQPKQVK